MPGFDFYTPIQPANIHPSLFSDAAKTGAEIGKMIPNNLSAAVTGITEGVEKGLDMRSKFENIQTAGLAQQKLQNELATQPEQLQVELNNAKLIQESETLKLQTLKATQQAKIEADNAVAKAQKEKADNELEALRRATALRDSTARLTAAASNPNVSIAGIIADPQFQNVVKQKQEGPIFLAQLAQRPDATVDQKNFINHLVDYKKAEEIDQKDREYQYKLGIKANADYDAAYDSAYKYGAGDILNGLSPMQIAKELEVKQDSITSWSIYRNGQKLRDIMNDSKMVNAIRDVKIHAQRKMYYAGYLNPEDIQLKPQGETAATGTAAPAVTQDNVTTSSMQRYMSQPLTETGRDILNLMGWEKTRKVPAVNSGSSVVGGVVGGMGEDVAAKVNELRAGGKPGTSAKSNAPYGAPEGTGSLTGDAMVKVGRGISDTVKGIAGIGASIANEWNEDWQVIGAGAKDLAKGVGAVAGALNPVTEAKAEEPVDRSSPQHINTVHASLPPDYRKVTETKVLHRVVNEPILRKYGSLVKAIAATESGGDRNAKSKKGALGLMQLTGIAVEDLKQRGKAVNREVPEQNVEGGAAYIARLLNRFKSEPVALMAYNLGEGIVGMAMAEMGQGTYEDLMNQIVYMRERGDFPKKADVSDAKLKEAFNYTGKVLAYKHAFDMIQNG